MIEVRLFGDLRRYAGDPAAASGVVVHVPAGEAGTVGQVLSRLGIGPAEVGHVFLNGRLVPTSAQALSLGYPLVASALLSPEASLDVRLQAGDRLGVFARNMGVLVV